jgi:thiol-disulfide isomerase/thioredoxin
VKSGQILQWAFAAMAAIAVHSLVRTSVDSEARRVCTPLCALRPDYAGRNRLAPDFELPKITGGKGRLSDYRGKVVLLNFWSKTCRPCLDEMPSLARLARVLRGRQGVELLTVSTDESISDARDTVQATLGGPPPFVVFVDPESEVVAGKFGTKLYPETWFIDPKGIIRARVDGARDWNQPLPLNYALTLREPSPCRIAVSGGQPDGEWAHLCDDVPPVL